MVDEGSDAAAVLIGIPEFVVLAVVEDDGEVWTLVETRAGRVGCSGCGAVAESKGRREVKVRDLELAGRPSALVWRKRRWCCKEELCEVKTWTETVGAIGCRASLTERARAEACRLVGEEGRSVAEVARSLGVTWETVMRAVEDYGRPLVDDPARIGGVQALGIDETTWLAATRAHSTLFATGLVDTRAGLLLDVIQGRDSDILRDWLADRPAPWLAGVDVVCIDPFEAYRKGLKPHLKHATLVADPFHIVRLGNRAVDDVRRRTQQEQTGHRGRRGDPLYDIRKILLTASERLSDKGRARLDAALAKGDPRDEVVAAWLAKEHLREVYSVFDHADAAQLLDAVIVECAGSGIPELIRLAKTLTQWRAEILNHHLTEDSNGPTEAMNLLIKNIKRVGRGFTNFENYRLRLLLHCGVEWQTHRTASIRGRSPHLAA